MTRAPGTYANFRDPVGLVVRMLRSGDRAARAALVRAVLAVLATPLDLALRPLEARRLRAARPTGLPLVFIVGAPRSGTTLVYQTLARYLPVGYFTNLNALFPRSPIASAALLDRFRSRRRPDFHSYYGNTAGLAGPNDGFHVWDRWLGCDRYRAPQQLGDAAIRSMRTFFDAWLTASGRPLLNKNNRNTDCVSLLGAALPDARFIEVRRDPVYVAQSLLLARQRIQGSKAIGWGLRSRDHDPADGAGAYVDDVCDQVFAIDTRLREDRARLGRGRFIEMSYERFCADPAGHVRLVFERVWGAPLHDGGLQELRPFAAANRVGIEDGEFERIRRRMADLYGAEPLAPIVTRRPVAQSP
jgi:hypothetical protein